MKIVLKLTVLIVLLFTSCNNTKNQVSYATANNNIENDTIHQGKILMETYCYTCHDAATVEDKRVAPPMIAIKKHYMFKDTSKEEFITSIQNWIKNPNEKDAKMYGAVRRFGIMQKIPYSKENIQKIADYIYDNEIEEPEWFDDHFRQRAMNKETN